MVSCANELAGLAIVGVAQDPGKAGGVRITCQAAEVVIPHDVFADILRRINRPRQKPARA